MLTLSSHKTKLKKRSVNGVLLLDKPVGCSSNFALQQVKRLFHAKKAGHTGSLDPLASGMLPICLGEATKFSRFLLASEKTYSVVASLGVRTDTGDQEGKVICQRPVPSFTLASIECAFDRFRGLIEQVPPMYSALKHQGKPLYKLARQGIQVDRPKRLITIHELTLIRLRCHRLEFSLRCSKGTYVRTLVDDLGEVLGCGAHVLSLRRLVVGHYRASDMIDMERLNDFRHHLSELDHCLLPLSSVVLPLPEVRLTDSMAFYLQQGRSLKVPDVSFVGFTRVMAETGRFLGVGQVSADQRLTPCRLLSSSMLGFGAGLDA